MDLTRIVICVAVFCVTTFLFWKAAGNLKIKNLNMISMLYYYMMVFNFAGGSLIYIGLRKHYLMAKITQESNIDLTYYYIVYCFIMFPLTLWGMKMLMEKHVVRRDPLAFIREKTVFNPNMVPAQTLAIVMLGICTLATLYVFRHLGYIPVLEVLKGSNLSALRQAGSRYFQGNQYIKNLLMITLTPFVSYYIYVYFRYTKNKVWGLLFLYSAFLSAVVLTYDFSKSPIIYYLLGIYLLECCMGFVKNIKKFTLLVGASVVILVFVYAFVFGVKRDILSIYTGPVGRILFTQIGTLFLHVEGFPMRHDFLDGASFNSWMSFLIPEASGLRSGRVIMEIYNASAVQEGTAGVMNTLFIGEAYANFGTIGVIIAPIIFGVVIGFTAYFLPALRKSPVVVLLYVKLTLQFLSIVEAGFVDILYSASTIFLILLAIMMYIFAEQDYPLKRNR